MNIRCDGSDTSTCGQFQLVVFKSGLSCKWKIYRIINEVVELTVGGFFFIAINDILHRMFLT